MTSPSSPDLRNRLAPLEMDSGEFRRLGHMLVDQLADAMAGVALGKVTPDETTSEVRLAFGLGQTLPEQGMPAADILSSLVGRLFDHSLFNAHPRFFGYITAPPAPIGVLGDLVASALNANVGSWRLSPAATEIEAETIRWIGELIGYPAGAAGLLVSGGNMANFVGFFAARAARAPRVRVDGLAASPQLVLYTSAETHTWIQKAADLSGLGTAAVRWIPTDASLRMKVDALETQIDADVRAGHVPFLVVGTAGSVSTGAVDPLPALARICRERGLWFHVDGAYGGFAAAAPNVPDDLRGIAEADSVAIDPHKWLYAPLEAGCAIVRDPAALRNAFAYHPPYYHFDEEVLNFVDYGPQNSRGFRALKVWLALRQAGATGYRRMIADDIRLSQLMAAEIVGMPDMELGTQALSIATFRYVPIDLRASVGTTTTEDYLNRLNQALLDRLQRGGDAFVSNAVVAGRYLLRACVVNFHATQTDVEAVPAIVAREGRLLDREIRDV